MLSATYFQMLAKYMLCIHVFMGKEVEQKQQNVNNGESK